MRAEPPIPPEALERIRAPFLAAGATMVDPPVIQPLSLFLDLAGEAMRARLFVVQDEGGREACLRPDFTVPVARMHIDSGAAVGRYMYEGKAFRVAPKGADADLHPEEFRQIGLEVYGGAADEREDADIAALAWRASTAGGRGDLAIRFGDITLLGAFLEAIDIPPGTRGKVIRALSRPKMVEELLDRAQAQVARRPDPMPELDGMTFAGAVERLREEWRANGIQMVGGRGPEEIVARLMRKLEAAATSQVSPSQARLIKRALAVNGAPPDALDALGALARGQGLAEAIERWRSRLAAMETAGIPAKAMTLEPGFGRTFGYYSGYFFEIGSSSLPPDAPISAGGRYDRFLPQIGGAVGCIVRPARAWSGA